MTVAGLGELDLAERAALHKVEAVFGLFKRCVLFKPCAWFRCQCTFSRSTFDSRSRPKTARDNRAAAQAANGDTLTATASIGQKIQKNTFWRIRPRKVPPGYGLFSFA